MNARIKKSRFFTKLLLLTTGTLLSSTLLNAQESNPEVSMEYFNPVNYLIIFTFLILLIAIGVTSKVIIGFVNSEAGSPKKVHSKKPASDSSEKKQSWWQRIDKKLTDAVPIEKEADVLLDHEYEGIKELDNSLPPWWIYGFYLTIVFAIAYMVHYHVSGTGKLQLEEYEEQLAEAEVAKAERLKFVAALVDENSVTLMEAESDLAEGKKIFIEKCAVCHGQLGEGGVGPNMTDDYWVHGGSLSSIFKVIKYGVPQKGMIAWQAQLKPVEIQQLSSFIKTLHGTNPPNGKEPQGDLYQEESALEIENESNPESTASEVVEKDLETNSEESQ